MVLPANTLYEVLTGSQMVLPEGPIRLSDGTTSFSEGTNANTLYELMRL